MRTLTRQATNQLSTWGEWRLLEGRWWEKEDRLRSAGDRRKTAWETLVTEGRPLERRWWQKEDRLRDAGDRRKTAWETLVTEGRPLERRWWQKEDRLRDTGERRKTAAAAEPSPPSLFRYPFHPRVTAVARKRYRPFYQKCRWQVTAKHTGTLGAPSLCLSLAVFVFVCLSRFAMIRNSFLQWKCICILSIHKINLAALDPGQRPSMNSES